jgi:exopolysaccharide biosynthesis polyprenyl glycosylphosphotransferase
MVRQFSLRFTLFLFVSDILLADAALLLSVPARTYSPIGKSAGSSAWMLPLPIYLLAMGIWAVTFTVLNVYTPRQVLYLKGELVRVAEATAFAWLVMAGGLYFSYREVSRLQMIYFAALYLVLITAHRLAVRGWFRLRGGSRYAVRRVLIVGSGELAREIADTVRGHAWMGLSLVGFVDNIASREDQEDLPVIGRLGDIPALVRQHDVSEIVIALPRDAMHSVQAFVHRLQALPVNIRLVPDYFDMVFLRINVENFSGMPLLSLKEPVLDPFQRLVKRCFDLSLTTLLLIPAAPLMALIAVAIKLDSPGPVLFKQQRVGENGRLFTMIKFRSMIVGAEHIQDQITVTDAEGNLIHKRPGDPRVTRVGRLLRRTTLDELPQLWNILRGEMSWVGPRPEMPWLVDQYEDWQRKRFEVPQGLTGWWQISGRADRPMHLNTEDDLFYIRNYSLWLDIKIVWRTIQAVILGRGAY